MSERAVRRMTFEEFLEWEDGADTRYKLIDGFPVALTPPAETHRMLATQLTSRIDGAFARRRLCNARIGTTAEPEP